jgi:Mn-dependent DtxR family transcriptional regulator
VNEEDTDWMLYHLFVEGETISTETLVKKSGLDPAIVTASLDRLARYLLIEKDTEGFRLLSIGESIMKCQAKYDTSLPFVIENGVIKERK